MTGYSRYWATGEQTLVTYLELVCMLDHKIYADERVKWLGTEVTQYHSKIIGMVDDILYYFMIQETVELIFFADTTSQTVKVDYNGAQEAHTVRVTSQYPAQATLDGTITWNLAEVGNANAVTMNPILTSVSGTSVEIIGTAI